MANIFLTSSGSVYALCEKAKVITGGNVGNQLLGYIPEKSRIAVGEPAMIYLQNGELLRTSTITGVL